MLPACLEYQNPEQKNINYDIHHPMIHSVHKDMVVNGIMIEQELIPLLLILVLQLISIFFHLEELLCYLVGMLADFFQGWPGCDKFLEVSTHILSPCVKYGATGNILNPIIHHLEWW